MRKKITLLLFSVITIGSIIYFASIHETKIEKLREDHVQFLEAHPFNESLQLSKAERKKLGIPPNKYFERQYLLEMNPATGRPEFEKKFELQEKLQKNSFLKNVPGTSDNAWVERGPSNVPGRTRAMLYDPNDATNKRVFAGGVSGGLWVNNDISQENSPWQRVGIPENLAVSSLTVDPNDTNIMYLGTGESYVQGQVNGNGVWKSIDGGANWSHIFGGSSGETFFNGNAKVTINSPGSIAGEAVAVRATFGLGFLSPLTGNLVVADDGTSTPIEGCNPFTNTGAINGNIAVVQRGTCNFTVKVKNAQNAGAKAVLVINNADGNPIAMGGSDPTVTIPSVMISKEDGASILATLQSQTVNVTLDNFGNGLPGATLVPGIFHINDIVTRNNGGVTEIYAAVAMAVYRESLTEFLGGGEFGLYKSTNGGATWSKVTLPNTTTGSLFEPNDIEISSNNTIWVSTTDGLLSFANGGGTIFSSTDGNTFMEKFVVPNGSRTEIEISATNPDKLYVLARANPITIIKTEDGFDTTLTMNLPDDADNGIDADDFTRGQSYYDLMLEADPSNDNIVYVGGIDTFRSADGGITWVQISKWSNNPGLGGLSVPFVHADIHDMTFDPSNPDKAMIATDGGVFYANSLLSASSSPSAIVGMGNDYNTSQFYWGSIGQSISNDQFLAGAQDNGSNFIDNASSGTTASEEISGGDGAYNFIDKDGQYLITSYIYNSFYRFDLPITSGLTSIVENTSEGDFINPAELDDNLDILFSNASDGSGYKISRFSNLTAATPLRADLSDDLLNRSPTVLKVSPFTTASTKLFVGTDTGRLLKVENANNIGSWFDISGPEFIGSISAVNFGANEDEIIVTFHNYGVKSIWFTEDGGSSWLNKEGDFPDIPVKAVIMNPLLNDEVIIGTDLGVWRTVNFKNSNPTWVQSQIGMQNVKVTSFDLRIADNTVLASTYGRGLFTSKFTDVVLAIDDISSISDEFTVFPNPSNGKLKIKSLTDFGYSKIALYDLNGREVFTKNENIMGTINLDLEHLSKGIYVLKINGESLNLNKKILIE